MKVPISKIKRSPFEARDTYGAEDFEDLKQQAKAGLIYPLLVRPLDGEYELVDGHRRLAALKAVGAKEAPIAIYEADDYELASIAVDIGTRTHSEVEKGEMVWRWLERQLSRVTGDPRPETPYGFVHSHLTGGSWSELNEAIGDPYRKLERRFGSLHVVRNWLRAYKDIAPPVREMLSRGEITSSQARHVAEGLPGRPELQERVAKKIAREEVGASEAVQEITRAVRAVEKDEELVEAVLETPWTKTPEEVKAEAKRSTIYAEAARIYEAEKEKRKRKGIDWDKFPSAAQVLHSIPRVIALFKSLWPAVEIGKLSPEAKRFLARKLRELIELLQGYVNALERGSR